MKHKLYNCAFLYCLFVNENVFKPIKLITETTLFITIINLYDYMCMFAGIVFMIEYMYD